MTHSRYKTSKAGFVAKSLKTHWGPNPPNPLGRYAPSLLEPSILNSLYASGAMLSGGFFVRIGGCCGGIDIIDIFGW